MRGLFQVVIAFHILEYIRQPLAVDVVASNQPNVVKLVIQRVSNHRYNISTHPDNRSNILLFRYHHSPKAHHPSDSSQSLTKSMVMQAAQLHINLTVLKLLNKIQLNMYNLTNTIQQNLSHFIKKQLQLRTINATQSFLTDIAAKLSPLNYRR